MDGAGPLGLSDAGFCQVLADFGGCGGAVEAAAVDEKRFMVNGGVVRCGTREGFAGGLPVRSGELSKWPPCLSMAVSVG